jgi:hypothetical protein
MIVSRLRPCPSCGLGVRERAALILDGMVRGQAGYTKGRLEEAARLIRALEYPLASCSDCDEGNGPDGNTMQELEVELTGTFVAGLPATGPSYSSGGEPGEPDRYEDIAATWANPDTGEDEMIELTEAELEIAETELLEGRA